MSRVDEWINRSLRIALVFLMAVACFFLWRISMAAYQVERMLADNQEDMAQIVGTAAAISEKIDELSRKIEELEERARENLPIDEVEALMEDFGEVTQQLRAEKAVRSATVEAEIRFLLDLVRNSTNTFGYSDKEFSSRRLSFLLNSKHRLLGKGLESAEQFIRDLGTQTVNGKKYFIVLDANNRKPLAEWLTEELTQYRQTFRRD
jgi:hypothetical protein